MRSLLGLLEPEEFVGKLWHRAAGFGAPPRFPEAASRLDEARASLGVLFRGLAGPRRSHLCGVGERVKGGSARWRERRSGSATLVSRRDGQALYLPAVIDLWPERADNRALHVWLAAFFVHLPPRAPAAPGVVSDVAYLVSVAAATERTLGSAPGLHAVHARLCDKVLAARPPRKRPPAEAAVERAVRALLVRDAGRVQDILRSRSRRAAAPLLPSLRACAPMGRGDRMRRTAPLPRMRAGDPAASGQGDEIARKARRETQNETQRQDYLALNRFEKMLTLAEVDESGATDRRRR